MWVNLGRIWRLFCANVIGDGYEVDSIHSMVFAVGPNLI